MTKNRTATLRSYVMGAGLSKQARNHHPAEPSFHAHRTSAGVQQRETRLGPTPSAGITNRTGASIYRKWRVWKGRAARKMRDARGGGGCRYYSGGDGVASTDATDWKHRDLSFLSVCLSHSEHSRFIIIHRTAQALAEFRADARPWIPLVGRIRVVAARYLLFPSHLISSYLTEQRPFLSLLPMDAGSWSY
ncbi:hypothetical protein BGZ61DRAFT_80783 [Ilyonectria robusta]|uniref:uncharacterized protein n=1 Tax=Ilyonectria robusta TaxID=1079257 RepID=UPI001E8CBE4E|nr:uncharacterized protein BGZ61DRAFT_80783 [Ilyonectria robusta]KAH8735527.1 hypothetical protein BGZ61DRAFT_80783 [Ilyonectria robusta]